MKLKINYITKVELVINKIPPYILVQKLGIPIMQNLIHAVIWIRIAK